MQISAPLTEVARTAKVKFALLWLLKSESRLNLAHFLPAGLISPFLLNLANGAPFRATLEPSIDQVFVLS